MDDKTYQNSELILNPDGSVYHLKLKPEQLAENIILVGDPQRVEQVSDHFDIIESTSQNREIVTHTGEYKGTRITAMSTGMGTDNIDIVLNELDALANIDLENRKPKHEHKALNLIRIGTSGALQKDIPINSIIASSYGMGLDGLAYFYQEADSIIEEKLTSYFKEYIGWKDKLSDPYAIKASSKLLHKIGNDMIQGITLTAPGFYGPQGRTLRLTPSWPNLFDKIAGFDYNGLRITNFEMETSALFALGKMLGHETLTVCMAIANRETGDYSQDYKDLMSDLIKKVLDRLTG